MQILLQKGPLVIRRAEKSDVPAITKLIQALALYEKAPEQCFATDELIESSVFDRGEAQVLMAAIETLCEREKRIILMRFGFLDGTEYTQKEVADMLGISQSYISRLEKRIIARLRKEMVRQMQV